MTLILLVAMAVLTALFLVHRLALWMERRGWIYYRKRGRASIGNAMMEIQSFYRPSVEHVIELKQDEATAREEDDAGDGRITEYKPPQLP